MERYGETLFVVLRPAWYIDAEESVEFGEVHLFVGPEFVVTIRHAAKPDLATVRRGMEDTPEFLARGPQAVLYAVLDELVDTTATSRAIFQENEYAASPARDRVSRISSGA